MKEKTKVSLRVQILKKLTNKKYKCLDCEKKFHKYQMYICPTCNKPTFCNICLKNISYFECIT